MVGRKSGGERGAAGPSPGLSRLIAMDSQLLFLGEKGCLWESPARPTWGLTKSFHQILPGHEQEGLRISTPGFSPDPAAGRMTVSRGLLSLRSL